MKTKRLLLTCFAILSSGLMPARAQTTVWKTMLKKTGGAYEFSAVNNFNPGAQNALNAAEKVTLEVSCDGVDGRKLKASLMGNTPAGGGSPTVINLTTPSAAAATLALATFEVKGSDVSALPGQKATLSFTDNTTPTNVRADVGIIGPGDSGTSGGGIPSKDCDDKALNENPKGSTMYDEPNNTATFVLSHTGNVLRRPNNQIDEDDKIIVKVYGPREEVSKLIIQRKSAFRDLGAYRVLGEGTDLSGFKRLAATINDCSSVTVELADFAPGQGEIQLSRIGANNVVTPLSSFDFGVHPLYRGAFAFGPMYSWLTDRTFGIVAKGSDNVVTVTEQSPRIHYVLSYIHYWQGPVDVEKRGKKLRIYPMFGLPVQNTLKNAFVGLTGDVSVFYFMAGRHFGQITVIDPNSGLNVGSVLPAGVANVPTRTEIRDDWYVGVGLDLRATAKFITVLLTAK